MTYTTIDDVTNLFRDLTADETNKALGLIPVIESSIKLEAERAGKDLDILLKGEDYKNVFKSVVVDVVGRTLMTATDQEPMTQESQSALGYSWSGTYLVPGGGLFIKKSELDRLGLRRQKYGVIDLYDTEN